MSMAEMLRLAALRTVGHRLSAMAGRDLELDALRRLSKAELDLLAERECYFTSSQP